MASATFNVWRGKGDQPISPMDFLPEKLPKNEDEMIDAMINVFGELGNLQYAQPN